MSYDLSMLALGAAPLSTLIRCGVQPMEIVQVSLESCGNSDRLSFGASRTLNTCIVQLIPSQIRSAHEVLLHPLLCDILIQSAKLLPCSEVQDFDSLSIGAIAPYPGMNVRELSNQAQMVRRNWRISRVVQTTASPNMVVRLRCLDMEREVDGASDAAIIAEIKSSLSGRWIMAETVMVLAMDRNETYVIVTVDSVNDSKENVAYQLGPSDTFQVILTGLPPSRRYGGKDGNFFRESGVDQTCPGYEGLVDEIYRMVTECSAASPTGLVLNGCVGIGKTRLLQSVEARLQAEGWFIRYISLQQLLIQASWSSEEDLLNKLVPATSGRKSCYLFDDLDVFQFGDASGELSSLDYERRILFNCAMQAIDRLVKLRYKVIGAARTTSRLPPMLLVAGRLEKAVEMSPPTQMQRESIIYDLLARIGYDNSTAFQWSELLAAATAGYVAADLNRLAAYACHEANDGVGVPEWKRWKEATHACTPAQLAYLDVSKPMLFFDDAKPEDWLTIHYTSWKRLCGYDSVKKKVFRTVVVPWRRQLGRTVQEPEVETSIAPPSGVLFHGPSGCGKTLAAVCLGSSIGMSMIKVRVADVLDKWLGGSEEMIRSLFSRARSAAPCILFFDDIDSIAHNRGVKDDSADVMSRLLSTLLNELDGISSGRLDNVFVVACTNRIDSLDAALLRPGRLEEHVEMQLPTLVDVQDILQHNFSRVPLVDNVDIEAIAGKLQSKGASAADVVGVVRESVFRCMRRSCTSKSCQVSQLDIEESIDVLKL